MRKRKLILSIMMVLLVLTIATTSALAYAGVYGIYRNAIETLAYQGADLCKKATAEAKASTSSLTKFTVGYGTGTNMKSSPILLSSSYYVSRSYGWVPNTINYLPYCRSYLSSSPSSYEYVIFWMI